MRELENLARGGKTVIAITHNMNLAAAYANHVIVMHEGVVLLDGTREKCSLSPKPWPEATLHHPR